MKIICPEVKLKMEPEVKLKIICPRKEEGLAAVERRNYFGLLLLLS